MEKNMKKCVYRYTWVTLPYSRNLQINYTSLNFFLKTLRLIKLKQDPAFKYTHLFKTKSRLQFGNTKKEKKRKFKTSGNKTLSHIMLTSYKCQEPGTIVTDLQVLIKYPN